MKYFYLAFSTVLATVLFNSCAGNKELQERSPAQFDHSYFISAPNSLQLFIPIKTIQLNRISLDSVYFRGMKSSLELDPKKKGVYTAYFNTGNEDLIMSADPAEEYANKMPQRPVKIPFELKESEAVIVFKDHNKRRFYKISGIKERSKEESQ